MPTNPNPPDSSPGRRLATSAVSTRPNDSNTSRRSLPVISLGRFPTQISILCPFHVHRQLVFRGRAKPGERIRETGLKAGDAICGTRSCFKASSGDHPGFTATLNHYALYEPAAPTQAVFYFCLHNIYKSSLSGPKSGIRHKKSAGSHASAGRNGLTPPVSGCRCVGSRVQSTQWSSCTGQNV